MRQPPVTTPTRDEALWMLTGLLVGLAVWLVTDVLMAGIGIGVALGALLTAQERSRQGSDRARPAAS